MSEGPSGPIELRLESLGRTLAALDAAVRGHASRLESLEQAAGRLDGYSSEQAGVLAELLPRVDQLAAAVEVPGDGLGSKAVESAPVVWALLSAEDAWTAWNALSGWVETVAVPTLAPTARQIPPCWPMHVWGRETLSWLHQTHVQAYGAHGSAAQAAEWHTRWVAQAYSAIDARGAAPGGYCDTAGHHSERVERSEPLRTEDWSPWLVRARDCDVERRRAEPPGGGR
ncbi:hypothetical protein AD006_30410 (plasmid) [Pseudonocardia sp. EC080610-09]|uniref:hypothetical protein n=1 Tax=unclassified Pseudonocardia TaxID=2619320 RepID=UPI000706BA4C|nr:MULTISPECIES: hypothetical protein [unclassified Pseudonocardia]ALL79535.1 hypothetical protein AD006_30410 [Pseudonocardia sp. EC080610-09]ALL85512.1 hypothetical protein AD017_30840 [Pseudonocardia sp. EC080619-01]